MGKVLERPKTTELLEAGGRWSLLLGEVSAGGSVLITCSGRPCVRPHSKGSGNGPATAPGVRDPDTAERCGRLYGAQMFARLLPGAGRLGEPGVGRPRRLS